MASLLADLSVCCATHELSGALGLLSIGGHMVAIIDRDAGTLAAEVGLHPPSGLACWGPEHLHLLAMFNHQHPPPGLHLASQLAVLASTHKHACIQPEGLAPV